MNGISRATALLDVIALIALFVVIRGVLSLAHVPKAASIAIVICVLFATWRLARSGENWGAVGFSTPESWLVVILLGLVAWLAAVLGVAYAIEPLADQLGLAPPAFSRLGPLSDNLPYFLFMLIFIAWGAAAFGEELVFRGFLQSRLVEALGGGRLAVVLAILIQAVLFGLGHLYLGARGALTAGMVGFVFGIFYVLAGRNLWPLIFAHGLMDSIALYALFAGLTQAAPD